MKKFSVITFLIALIVSICGFTSCVSQYDYDYDNGSAFVFGDGVKVDGKDLNGWTPSDPNGKMKYNKDAKAFVSSVEIKTTSAFKFIVNGSYWSEEKVKDSPLVKGVDDGFGGKNLNVTEDGTYTITVDINNEKITIVK